MNFTKADISTHRITDNTDPGFVLKGHKLRWISSIVEVRRAGRIWRPLKISYFPKEFVTEMKDQSSAWGEGDTIRRRDLVLSFAPMDQVKERQAEIKSDQNLNEGIFRGKKSRSGSAATSEGSMSSKAAKATKKGSDDFN